ncbi:hypothetical protein ERHA54_23200 [Erwinia rhapontici]|uniref:hypothetical protein n=1 Tax=Erwinia rhapontici TaxID=55212 RepID=UPI001BB3F974|nr:hypothetical protein [Erwinia rhapontici]BCQ39717.1 hypothetical protein ERHA54_23200 [Erwinia rhapontici]
MTVISSVGNLSVNTLPGATKLATTAAAVDTLQTPPLSSTTVSLGQSAAAPPFILCHVFQQLRRKPTIRGL